MSNQLTITNAVTIVNGQPVTTSLKIAEVFGKQHKDVLKAIRNLECPEDFNRRNFAPTERVWKNNLGKAVSDTMYEITRDGFTLLAMGFTGRKAMQFKLAYIEAYNEMERKLKEPAHSKTVTAPEQPELPEERYTVSLRHGVMTTKGAFHSLPGAASVLNYTTAQISYAFQSNKSAFVPGHDYFSGFGHKYMLTCRGLAKLQILAEDMFGAAGSPDAHPLLPAPRPLLPAPADDLPYVMEGERKRIRAYLDRIHSETGLPEKNIITDLLVTGMEQKTKLLKENRIWLDSIDRLPFRRGEAAI